MSMKKKSATSILTATIVGRTITGNKGMEGPTVMETDGKMQEI